MSTFMPNPDVAGLSQAHRYIFGSLFRIAALLGLAILALSSVNAQMSVSQNGTRQNPPQIPQIGVIPAGPNATFQERRIRQLNVERQKEMVSDTNDLLKLTAQLNAEVAKNHSTSLTPDQVRMLARIEKLAKSIREKMSDPVQRNVFEYNFPPPMAQPVIP